MFAGWLTYLLWTSTHSTQTPKTGQIAYVLHAWELIVRTLRTDSLYSMKRWFDLYKKPKEFNYFLQISCFFFFSIHFARGSGKKLKKLTLVYRVWNSQFKVIAHKTYAQKQKQLKYLRNSQLLAIFNAFFFFCAKIHC